MLKRRYIKRARVKILAIVSVISVMVTLRILLTPRHLDNSSTMSNAVLDEYSEYNLAENILSSEKSKQSIDFKSHHVSKEERLAYSKPGVTVNSKKNSSDVSKCGYNVS